jgi:Uma2 family endonuclease
VTSVLSSIEDAIHSPPATPDGLTVGDLFDRFGPIPLWRIVRDPAPGTATFDDLMDFYHRTGRFCELIDGILVEKDVSYRASRIGLKLGARITLFVEERNLGLVTGEQGFLRLTTGRVRGPDVAFVAWNRLPGGRESTDPVPNLAPTLAVEVLSPGNTKKEMEDKLADYFRSGVELVWYVYPDRKQVQVFTGPDAVTLLDQTGTLDGGTTLPGFAIPLVELFAEPAAGKNESSR